MLMSKLDAKLLIVDDDEDVLLAAKLYLKQHIKVVHTDKDPNNIPMLLKNDNYDMMLLDMNFSRDATSGKEGFYWLNKILEIDPTIAVVLITAYGDIELAVQGVKEGATNFLLKPWDNKKLLATITTTLETQRSKKRVAGSALQAEVPDGTGGPALQPHCGRIASHAEGSQYRTKGCGDRRQCVDPGRERHG